MNKTFYDPNILCIITNFTNFFIQNKSAAELDFWSRVFLTISQQIATVNSFQDLIEEQKSAAVPGETAADISADETT